MLLELRADKDEKKSDEQVIAEKKAEVIHHLSSFAEIYIDKAKELFKEVILVEQDYSFVIDEIPFRLIVDVVVRYKDGTLAILDFKTKSKAIRDLALMQLVSYGVGIEELLKEKVSHLEQWDFIRVKNPTLNVNSIDMKYFEGYKKVFLEEIKSFWNGIHNGHFTRNLKSMFCGESRCSFWNTCMGTGETCKDKKEIEDFHGQDIDNLSARRNR